MNLKRFFTKSKILKKKLVSLRKEVVLKNKHFSILHIDEKVNTLFKFKNINKNAKIPLK